MFEGGIAHAGSYRGTHVCANGYGHARADCHSRTDCDAGAHRDAFAGADQGACHASAGHASADHRASRGADPGA